MDAIARTQNRYKFITDVFKNVLDTLKMKDSWLKLDLDNLLTEILGLVPKLQLERTTIEIPISIKMTTDDVRRIDQAVQSIGDGYGDIIDNLLIQLVISKITECCRKHYIREPQIVSRYIH